MADTIPTTERAALPFYTVHEACFSGEDDATPALIINPAAGPDRLAVAALSRADALASAIDAWNCCNSTEIQATELASFLSPHAQEVVLLLRAMVDQLTRKQVAA